MKDISMIKAMRMCSEYSRLGPERRKAVRDARLRDIVMYAKEHSPYYNRLYRDIDDGFELSSLPPVCKAELMRNFDDWLTVRDVTLETVREFMEDLDNVGRKLRGKYLVFTTSGSTGTPMISLSDKTSQSVMGAVNACRTFARRQDLKAFFLRGGKTIGVFATGGFYLGNGSVRARVLNMPWKKRQIAVTSALLPLGQIVDRLNEFSPAMLGGYPSSLELLIDEKRSGRLRISPVLIMTGGEYLPDSLRQRLADAFGCYVQTSYSCTEGGTLACECAQKRYHINDDWIIIEPVDKTGAPVPCGAQADKIYMTNLFNYTQPFIRYEITDRVVMSEEMCECGNPSPWLTLEGRSDDTLTLSSGEGAVRLPPMAIYATLKETNALRLFQVVSKGENEIDLRLIPEGGHSRESAFESAKAALDELFLSHGASGVKIALSPEEPMQHPQSGKFKHVISGQWT